MSDRRLIHCVHAPVGRSSQEPLRVPVRVAGRSGLCVRARPRSSDPVGRTRLRRAR